MNESPDDWILKRRHEDLSLTVRTSWSLYIQFYTVFLTVSVVGLGWVLTRPADAPIVPRTKHVITIVFVVQTLLTAVTSVAIALYTMRVARDQEQIENCLVQSHAAAPAACRASRPRIVGSVRWLVQLCGYDCHGRFVALRRFHFLAA
jgi:hypothetical protein